MENRTDFEDFEIIVNEENQEETPLYNLEPEETPNYASENYDDLDADEAMAHLLEEEVQNEPDSSPEPAITLDILLEQVALLSSQNERLLKKFDDKIVADEHKSQLFDKMYNELQSYKTDLYAKLLKPFVLSAINMLDDTNTFIGKLGENESALAEKYLRSMPDDLVDLLESNGVVLYEDDSEKFNPRTQRTVKQVPTDKLELDNTVAKRIRKGYNWNGVNLKPELVWIYKFKKEEAAN